jgi:recombination protein RecT
MTNNLPAVAKQQVQVVENRVHQLQQAGQLDLPADYSVSNALRSAFLTLQETTDMQKKPALQVCTQASISNALLDMVVQGLNPARSQGYFLVYGQKLAFQRSYFGDMALAMRMNPRISDIVAEVIYSGDEFEFEVIHGKKRIVKHKQTIESLNGGQIQGAYCVVLDHEGQEISTVVMNWNEIKESWKKSPSKPFDDQGNLKPNSTHAKHTGEMAKRTVIRKACKPLINSGADSYLQAAVTRSEQVQAEHVAQVEAAQHANQGEILDVEYSQAQGAQEPEMLDAETGEVFDSGPEPDQAQDSEPAAAEAKQAQAMTEPDF